MIDREPIMLALLAKLAGAPCTVNFTADTEAGSAVLGNVSDAADLLKGMPVFGPGVREGAVLATLTPTVTMNLTASATATGAALSVGFRTSGRRLKHWTEVAEQPALFVDDGEELWPGHLSGIPAKAEMTAAIWIYSDIGKNPDAVPASVLNALLAAIETALAPQVTWEGLSIQNVQTLGGLVEHCWIEGILDKASGHTGGQAIAVVPIRMLVPQ
jgi:hypothetical protein